MLEVVDAERDRFLKAHRAKMPGDLDPLLVRLRDRRPQLGAANVGVRLDPRRPFRRPVGDEALSGRRRIQNRGENPRSTWSFKLISAYGARLPVVRMVVTPEPR